MKKSRIVSGMLVTALLVGACAMSGCGKEKETAEKPVLKVLTSYANEDLNTTGVAQVLEEKTGYKVEYEMLPQKNPNEKLNLIMAGGDAYDIVSMGGSESIFATYANNGALTELEPLLKEYGSNLLEKISEDSFNILKVNDVQYGIPNTSGVKVSKSLAVRKDWLDKLGLEMPETVDEFTNMLKEFKEKDPGGNGGKSAPLVFSVSELFLPNLQGAFGIATDWNEQDGKLVPNISRPETAKYIEYMRSLYKNGYIDKEFATLNSTTAKERFTSGAAGVMCISCFDFKTITEALTRVCPDAEIAYLPLLRGENGMCGIQSSAANLDKIIFIPKSAEHPEDAMKWMNLKLEDEIFREFTIGTEGVHYEIKDGSYYPILPKFFDDRNISSAYLTGVDEKVYPTYWQARIRKDQSIYDAWDYLNNNEDFAANMKVSPLANAPFIKGYDDMLTKLSSSNADFTVKAVADTSDVEKALKEYFEVWKANGGKEMAEAVNAWYDTVK